MIYAVLFEDNPGMGNDVRKEHMPAHLAFLKSNAGSIQAAGPLKQANDLLAGGLWIVEARSREEVDELVHEDPFWPTGLRRSVRILAWHQVFAGGDTLI